MSKTRNEHEEYLESLYRKENYARIKHEYNIARSECSDKLHAKWDECFYPGFFRSIKYKFMGEENGRRQCFEKVHADFEKCLDITRAARAAREFKSD